MPALTLAQGVGGGILHPESKYPDTPLPLHLSVFFLVWERVCKMASLRVSMHREKSRERSGYGRTVELAGLRQGSQ